MLPLVLYQRFEKNIYAFPGCLGLDINNDNIKKFIFLHSHGIGLYVNNTIGQTLYAQLMFPKGVNPSTAIASRTLRGSLEKIGHLESIVKKKTLETSILSI